MTEFAREATGLFNQLLTSDDEDDPYVPPAEVLTAPMRQLTIKDAIDCRESMDRRFLNEEELIRLDETLSDRVNNPNPFAEPPVVDLEDAD